MVSELLGVNGIGAATAEQLEQHGVNSIEELAAMDVAQLKTVPGFGEVRAAGVLANAREALRAMEEKKPESSGAKKGKGADKKALKKKGKKGKPAKKKNSKEKVKKDKKKAKGKKKKKSRKEKKGKDKKKK